MELVKEFGVKDTLEDLSMYQKRKRIPSKKRRDYSINWQGTKKNFLNESRFIRESVELKGSKGNVYEKTPTNAVKKFTDKSLLETDHNRNYWLHPLVQEFSYEDLKKKKKSYALQ